MFQKVALGAKVAPLGINRTVVADGCRCRAILLDRDPRVKYIAWDEELSRKVEVNTELVIKYRLRPMTNFYYLVAKLNTDMNGNVVGNQFVIEYLQLTENVNNEFSDAVLENPNFSSLLLTKVKKSVNGKDYGYIKPVPSNYELDSELQREIQRVISDTKAIEGMWDLIDKSTSLSVEEYLEQKALRAQNPENQNSLENKPAVQRLENKPAVQRLENKPAEQRLDNIPAETQKRSYVKQDPPVQTAMPQFDLEDNAFDDFESMEDFT